MTLGLIQGLSEFLPISSSAHLILAPWFFGWPDPGLTFDVALHVGTLVAVAVYFWRDWIQQPRGHGAAGGHLQPPRQLGDPAAPHGVEIDQRAVFVEDDESS